MVKKSESYSELRRQLDEILLKIQSGDLDIDTATEQYEQARLIVEKLEKYIQTAENKVTKIKKSV